MLNIRSFGLKSADLTTGFLVLNLVEITPNQQRARTQNLNATLYKFYWNESREKKKLNPGIK